MELKSFEDWVNEIDTKPVPVEWFYRKENEWFGEFKINDVSYDISFFREDKKLDLDFNVVSFKFARPDLDDPHAFSFDFNKPMVVKNTVEKEIKGYINSEHIDVFIVKGYKEEKSRIKRYRNFVLSLRKDFGLIFYDEFEFGKYTYFALFRNKEAFINRKEIVKTIIS